MEKKWYYLTFGQSHVHSFNGYTLDKDIVLAIKSDDYHRVREYVIKMFGNQWSNIYDEPHLEYYHRGLIEVEI